MIIDCEHASLGRAHRIAKALHLPRLTRMGVVASRADGVRSLATKSDGLFLLRGAGGNEPVLNS